MQIINIHGDWSGTILMGWPWRCFLLTLEDAMKAAIHARNETPAFEFRIFNTETGDAIMAAVL